MNNNRVEKTPRIVLLIAAFFYKPPIGRVEQREALGSPAHRLTVSKVRIFLAYVLPAIILVFISATLSVQLAYTDTRPFALHDVALFSVYSSARDDGRKPLSLRYRQGSAIIADAVTLKIPPNLVPIIFAFQDNVGELAYCRLSSAPRPEDRDLFQPVKSAEVPVNHFGGYNVVSVYSLPDSRFPSDLSCALSNDLISYDSIDRRSIRFFHAKVSDAVAADLFPSTWSPIQTIALDFDNFSDDAEDFDLEGGTDTGIPLLPLGRARNLEPGFGATARWTQPSSVSLRDLYVLLDGTLITIAVTLMLEVWKASFFGDWSVQE